MKTIKVVGEVGKKDKWYTGYALVTKTREDIVIEVQRWSYWCKKFGVAKAAALAKKGKIRRVGGVYTDLKASYNVKRLKKELLVEERERKIGDEVCKGS